MCNAFRLSAISAAIILALTMNSSTDLLAQDIAVKQIIVNSRWGGLGTPAAANLTIASDGRGFDLAGKRIDGALISAFALSLRAPSIPAPTFENLGLTTEWLVANHEGPSSHYQGGPENQAANQHELYRKRFEDPSFIAKLLPGIIGSFHSDDYPNVEIQIDFADGSSATVTSHAQSAYMLPWSVEIAGNKHETYDANISRALAALMPPKTTNRERIAGEGLTEAIKEAASRELEPELNLLDVENRTGTALTELRTQFTIVDAEINSFHSAEYGTEWNGKQPHETNLHVTLTRPDLPSSVSEALVLVFRNGRVDGVNEFLQSISKFETLVMSVPWLNDFISAKKRVPIRISYVHSSSMGEKAMRVFTADMHAINRDYLVQEAKVRQSDIALLTTGTMYAESYWLVFPDRHMILWRYNGPSGLLKFKTKDFTTGQCESYQQPSGGCVGAVISPDGSIAKH